MGYTARAAGPQGRERERGAPAGAGRAAPPGAGPVDPGPAAGAVSGAAPGVPTGGPDGAAGSGAVRWPALLDRDWRRALTVLLTLLGAVALPWSAGQVVRPILRTLLLFAFAGVLAFALAAPVEAIADRLRHRALAVVAVYLLVGATAVGGLTLLAGPFVAQATALGGELP